MKIVVLDGYALNPGDLNWDALEALGDLTVYDRSSPEEVQERAKDCDVLITNKAIVSAETIASTESLKYIGVLATGVNIVDVDAAAEKDIPVCNVVGYGPDSVAQMVFAHILNFTHRLADQARDAMAGGWSLNPDFCYWNFPLIELKDQTIGIVGLGQIGSATARIAQGFGMRVIATTRDTSRPAPNGVTWATLDELFAESDYISLHCPLTDETENMINTDRLEQMKDSAILINTGRGQLVDESALALALNAGQIAGAGLDVLSSEPPSQDNPLFLAKNCFITPHIAWATKAARSRLMDMAVENLRSFQRGEAINRVN
ncbi:D-2-hydroxyacid dehydrogenase [Opitutia bacterium ISCC 51]|nr:D-2-hydroxyacid dehydrogenase [Opitutae bacterium ISCC 51]QXD30265.1 D-2-hydroxyacid dehydrogenase [Opitutae bacterium ISCC 52]